MSEVGKMRSNYNISVMPGFVPGIHVFLVTRKEDVDSRDEPGHDER
jgi:hypothetical protein